jgi:hypothetical protein
VNIRKESSPKVKQCSERFTYIYATKVFCTNKNYAAKELKNNATLFFEHVKHGLDMNML